MAMHRHFISLNLLKQLVVQCNSSKLITSVIRPKVTTSLSQCRQLHMSSKLQSLDEFFDDPENWAVQHVKVGRGWKVEELRIKSNEDLHKLWYVLLKELNMLLTMEYACKEENFVFPNPERIDKVKDSMAHLESVVRERNEAYMMLETGESGERPGGVVKDIFGRVGYREYTECAVPAEFNKTYQKFKYIHDERLDRLNKLIDEKAVRKQRRQNREDRVHVARLFSEFPGSDVEVLQEQYPELDIEEIRDSPLARGHHLNNRN